MIDHATSRLALASSQARGTIPPPLTYTVGIFADTRRVSKSKGRRLRADETDKVFPHAYYFKDGLMHPGEKPGIGVDIDEALAARYPYHRAYLPVNRKLDGTMHSW
jgi:L-alanine-DL-glutamate epimerase-like enolase superfamily enzyme